MRETKTHTMIIAEIGVNHNGSEETAMEMVRVAAGCGCDLVKFQTFKAADSISEHAQKADYQIRSTDKQETQLQMVQKLELSHDAHLRIASYCASKGIEFLSTAFDFTSLDFLITQMSLQTLKFPSGEITNAPLLLAHAKTGRDIILSTGMCSLSDIEQALGVIAFGYINNGDSPSLEGFRLAYASAEGQKLLSEKVTLLHCTTEYPAPVDDINLNAMDAMRAAFQLPVGYSDHSAGIAVPIAAVAKGATIIEKHFTLDRNMEGPDHRASLEPDELKAMVDGVRTVERALGNGLKQVQPSEIGNREVARKSLVAARRLAKGTVLSEADIAIKRPGTGLSPMKFWDSIGEIATKDYEKDEEFL